MTGFKQTYTDIFKSVFGRYYYPMLRFIVPFVLLGYIMALQTGNIPGLVSVTIMVLIFTHGFYKSEQKWRNNQEITKRDMEQYEANEKYDTEMKVKYE